MPSANIFVNKKGIRNKLDEMTKRGRSPESFLAHVAYPMYIARQTRRWMTEGASDGEKWKPLNAKYAEWKRINMAGFPGNGTKMLIKTGKLAESVIGRKLKGEPTEVTFEQAGGKTKAVLGGSMGGGGIASHHAIVTKKRLLVYTDVEYAAEVNKARNIWKFNSDFTKRLRAMYTSWFATGSVRAHK